MSPKIGQGKKKSGNRNVDSLRSNTGLAKKMSEGGIGNQGMDDSYEYELGNDLSRFMPGTDSSGNISSDSAGSSADNSSTKGIAPESSMGIDGSDIANPSDQNRLAKAHNHIS